MLWWNSGKSPCNLLKDLRPPHGRPLSFPARSQNTLERVLRVRVSTRGNHGSLGHLDTRSSALYRPSTMEAGNLTTYVRKALALLCCLAVLVVTTSSQALWLNCDCVRTDGPEASCCCTQVDVEEAVSGCCPSLPQSGSRAHDDFQQHSQCDHCGCFDAPMGSDLSPFIHSVSGSAGDLSCHPLETALCSAVESLVGDGKIVRVHSPLLPAAAGTLDTVVLQL